MPLVQAAPRAPILHREFAQPVYQGVGLVLDYVSASDPPVAAGAETQNLGMVIEDTFWVRRILVHVTLVTQAQVRVYRRLPDGVWDIGTDMTPVGFAIANPYPLELAIAGSEAMRLELKNTDGALALGNAKAWLQLYDR